MEGQLGQLIRQKIVDAVTAPLPPYTPRDVYLPQVPGKACAVVGMRRAGKTTFLWQLLAERTAAGTPREGLLYFSFEDERLAGLAVTDLGRIVEEYYRLYPEWRDGRRPTFFFDEMQVVHGWERFVRRLLDTEQVEVFLSGSSARLLSREVATSMRGRAMEVQIYPFSFREFLRHRGEEPGKPPEYLSKAERSRLDHAFLQYLELGGFPEVQLLPSTRDRFELLRSYVDVVLLRDVIERYRVSNAVALRWMVRHLLGNPCGRFSIHRLFNDLKAQGIAVAKDTLHAFFAYLQDAFLVYAVPISARSERQRMVNPRKVYPIDPGLISVFGRTGTDIGHRLESAVLVELLRQGLEPAYVWTENGFEVDFYVRDFAGRESLIQVVATLESPTTREREVRALLQAAREYPHATLHLITPTAEFVRDIPQEIQVHPAAAWFLRQEGR